MVNASKIMAMVSPDSAPSKRLVAQAKESKKVIDATQGRRTKAVLILDDGFVVLSALMPETIANRFKDKEVDMEDTR